MRVHCMRAAVSAFALAALSVMPGLARGQQPPPKPAPPPPPGMPGMSGMTGMGPDSTSKQAPAAGGMNMPGMNMSGMAMPIPMPAGMPMVPGLIGLAPGVAAFLPGAGVDPMQLPAVKPAATLRLRNGDTLDLSAMLVRRTIKGRAVAMYGYNGQVPGPLIRVPQNATIVVRFHNHIDLPSAVHWHGVRLDNRYDGAPGVTQDPVKPGDSFEYRVHFPDAGLYWYHPHVREDIEQAMGLFGNMIVDAPDSAYYSPANQEQTLVLDDLLVNADTLIPFGREGPDFSLMGRVGSLVLVNGGARDTLHAHTGEVVRFYLTNVASSRTFNVSFGDAPMKVLASNVSRFEHEERVQSVVMAPAERYIIEARFEHPGQYALVNSVQGINHFKGEFEAEVDTLGIVTVDAAPATPDYAHDFATMRANPAVSKDIDRFRPYFNKPPDKRFTLTLGTTGLPLATVQFMDVDTAYYAPVEYIDAMPDMNWLSTSKQVQWEIRDQATGKNNMDIDWHVQAGSIVKVQIFNDPKSFHPMQHPIHLHGQRMLVVARDGVATKDLVWKDTVIIPVGSTVDLLIDASNPGVWMMHCHIAEHLESGMMTELHVDPPPGGARQ